MKKIIFNEKTKKYQEQTDEKIIGYDINGIEIYEKSEEELSKEEHQILLDQIKSNEYSKIRYEICLKCKNFNKLKFCKICWCYIPLKIKFKDSTCPINKWTEIRGN